MSYSWLATFTTWHTSNKLFFLGSHATSKARRQATKYSSFRFENNNPPLQTRICMTWRHCFLSSFFFNRSCYFFISFMLWRLFFFSKINALPHLYVCNNTIFFLKKSCVIIVIIYWGKYIGDFEHRRGSASDPLTCSGRNGKQGDAGLKRRFHPSKTKKKKRGRINGI